MKMWHLLEVVHQAERKLIVELKIWRQKLFIAKSVRDSKMTRFSSETKVVWENIKKQKVEACIFYSWLSLSKYQKEEMSSDKTEQVCEQIVNTNNEILEKHPKSWGLQQLKSQLLLDLKSKDVIEKGFQLDVPINICTCTIILRTGLPHPNLSFQAASKLPIIMS